MGLVWLDGDLFLPSHDGLTVVVMVTFALVAPYYAVVVKILL